MIIEDLQGSRLDPNLNKNFSPRFDERVPGVYLFNSETGKVYNIKGHTVDNRKHCVGKVGPEGEFYKVIIDDENVSFHYM